METTDPAENLVLGDFHTKVVDMLGTRCAQDNSPYATGMMAGQQDRAYADYYAGANNRHVLIEFKRTDSEIATEAGKPLRGKLCKTLTEPVAKISRSCHFVGWGNGNDDVESRLCCYIDRVCPLFGCTECLKEHAPIGDQEFIGRFIAGKIGANHDDFSTYITHLQNIKTGTQSPEIPFTAILYTKNDQGFVRGRRFNTLDELKKLIEQIDASKAQNSNPKGTTNIIRRKDI